MRSKFLGYLPDIMHSKAFKNPFSIKTKEDELKLLGPVINLFGPIDILNGHSVIEFFDTEVVVKSYLENKEELKQFGS